MKALVYRRTGPAQEVFSIEQLAQPSPGPREVRIKVAYSGVNPSDVKARSGLTGGGMAYPYVVPHSDGSGVVDAVGSEADAALVGARVWFYHAQWKRQFGSAAEYVCLPREQVVPLPDSATLQTGAALGIPLITAWHAVHGYEDVAGKTVLVTGGAGNVGFYAIQLAKLAGARVVATVSSPAKADVARSAGADLVLEYADAEAVGARLCEFSGGRGVDLIIEVNASHNAGHYDSWLATGGRVVVYGSQAAEIPVSYRGMMRVFGTLSFFIVYLLPPAALQRALDGISALLAQSRLRHLPATVFPLADAALAHQHVEAAQVGKALLALDGL